MFCSHNFYHNQRQMFVLFWVLILFEHQFSSKTCHSNEQLTFEIGLLCSAWTRLNTVFFLNMRIKAISFCGFFTRFFNCVRKYTYWCQKNIPGEMTATNCVLIINFEQKKAHIIQFELSYHLVMYGFDCFNQKWNGINMNFQIIIEAKYKRHFMWRIWHTSFGFIKLENCAFCTIEKCKYFTWIYAFDSFNVELKENQHIKTHNAQRI